MEKILMILILLGSSGTETTTLRPTTFDVTQEEGSTTVEAWHGSPSTMSDDEDLPEDMEGSADVTPTHELTTEEAWHGSPSTMSDDEDLAKDMEGSDDVTQTTTLRSATSDVTQETSTLRPTTSDVAQACTTVTKADIVFLVDGSGSIGSDFQKIRQFLHSFIEGLDIGSDKVHVGLAQYSDRQWQEFLLKDHTDKTALLQEVGSLPYRRGGTYTGQGIKFLQTQYFTKEAGSRADEQVPQIAVVITDGESVDDVVAPSQLLRNQGVIMFVIGVGSYKEDQLKSMVEQPHEQFLFQIDNFQALQRVTEGLLQTVCNSVSAFVSGLATCEKQADLVMLIDQSSGIDPSDYTVMKTFVTDLLASFNVSKEFVRVGVAQFSSSPQKVFYLNEFYNETAVKNQILGMSQLRGGGRNIGRALKFIQDYFQASRGSRKSQGISQNLVLITDGHSQDSVEEAAAKLQAEGIEVFAIGTHQHPGDQELLHITGSSDHFFTVHNFSSLVDIKQKVVKSICDSIPDRPETMVHCTESSMTVVVVKSDLIQLNADKLHLKDFNDPACSLTTHSNHSHLVAVMSLNSCGTILEEDEGNLIFRNEITSAESADTSQVISRTCYDVQIAFSCVYPKRSALTLGFKHKSPCAFTWKGYGAFSLPFEFFESEQFRRQKRASTYPVKVFLNQMIYLQIQVNTSIPGIQLFVESCMATPYDNPNSDITYTIIENGCVRDKTVKIYNGSNSQFRLGMKAFTFIGDHEQVYISCSVMQCRTGVPGSRCSQGCISGNQRGKRNANANAQSDTYSISQGPLQLVRADDSQGSGPSMSLSLSMNLVFIAGCVLVCGVVCGVVVYRSRRVQYQPPPTSD